MNEAKESNFKCEECGSSFRKSKHLRYHVETVHATDRKYVCDVCGKSYKRSSHLKRHAQNSHSTVDIACSWEGCGRVFKGPEQLRKHMRRHETKDTHQCEVCGKRFSKKRQLESHCLKIHGPFPCVQCDRVFSSRREFKLHISSVHFTEGVLTKCSYCDEYFSSNSFEYRSHLRTHNSFQCSLCGAKFSRERDLRAHVLEKHDPEHRNSVFACQFCGTVFSTVSNLNSHIRASHGVETRTFNCMYCSKAFAHKHVLQRHIDSVHFRAFTPEKQPFKRPKTESSDNHKLPVIRRVFTVSVGPDDLL